MSDRLTQIVEELGIVPASARGLSEAADVAAEWINYEGIGIGDLQGLTLQALGKVKAAAPRLAETSSAELRELLATGFKAIDAGYPEGIRKLAFLERRELFRAVTVEETQLARLRAERLDFLADLLVELGVIAVKVLPLLIAAL